MIEDEASPTLIKIFSIIFLFTLIIITGNLPLRWQQFRESTKLISLATGFSGGLFLAVGIIHLLPEAKEAFEEYYLLTDPDDNGEHFPWANCICVLCFAVILFIEKIAFASDMEQLHHHQSHHADTELQVRNSKEHKEDLSSDLQMSLLKDSKESKVGEYMKDQLEHHHHIGQTEVKAQDNNRANKMTAYILQFAIGVHAIFEGMAIGLESNFSSCLGIALAVACHKWAEGLTLGIAFFKAGLDLKTANIMVCIQAVMNPIGVIIGWLLSNQGNIIRGIFESISAGTFVYIATVEVIAEEFSLKRYKIPKFILFMLAIGFVCCLYLIEQATESEH